MTFSLIGVKTKAVFTLVTSLIQSVCHIGFLCSLYLPYHLKTRCDAYKHDSLYVYFLFHHNFNQIYPFHEFLAISGHRTMSSLWRKSFFSKKFSKLSFSSKKKPIHHCHSRPNYYLKWYNFIRHEYPASAPEQYKCFYLR